jgi:hypothetical protein
VVCCKYRESGYHGIVLTYLVSSPARRRLLEVLWLEQGRGSVPVLAKRAVVSFASAYRELHAMLRHELVTASPDAGQTVFAANGAHPLADAVRALVGYRPVPVAAPETASLRAQLASLGAPIGSEAEVAPAVDDLEATVVAGVGLCRQEPSTARAFPVLLHRVADRLDFERLAVVARARHVRHPLGFLLALTGKLGRAPRLTRVAREFRDHRVHAQQFFLRPVRRGRTESFPLAASWGFTLAMDEASFASTFRRFASAGVAARVAHE